jgi:hypothetical protein
MPHAPASFRLSYRSVIRVRGSILPDRPATLPPLLIAIDPLFICPTTDEPLHPAALKTGGSPGALVSPSGRSDPIRSGIARFVTGDTYGLDFGMQWQIFSRIQFDRHKGTAISRDRLFRLLQRWLPSMLRVSNAQAAIPRLGLYLRKRVSVANDRDIRRIPGRHISPPVTATC